MFNMLNISDKLFLAFGLTFVISSYGIHLEQDMMETTLSKAGDSTLIFRDETLKVVVDELSEFFEIEFKIKSEKILKCRITGTFNNKELPQILRDISLILPIEWSISHNSVTIKGKGCN